jgi:SAM-dependent methyltransferase
MGMAKQLDPHLFRSPIKLESLREDTPQTWIADGGAKYPLIGGLPVLLPDSRLAVADLKTRALGLISHYEKNVADLKLALKSPSLEAITKERIEKTREVQIRHLEFLKDLFSPLKLNAKIAAQPQPEFGYKLPPGQGLQGYFPNLVRDWSSRHGENEEQLEVVRSEIGGSDLGVLVVAGSGGGRLAYDVHELGLSETTICCDINLVLSLAAERISKGETLKVAEFPIAPKNLNAAPGAVRECRAPRPARAGLHHVIADVYYLPFADASVDTVLTPWLVDILPHRFEFIVSEINRVLKPGGRWINSGSFNFRFANWGDCLSVEEGLLAIEKSGFKTQGFKQNLIPYLRSDLDSHERNELITTFSVTKTAEAKKHVPLPVIPSWLSNPQDPIPTNPQLPLTFASLESQAFVLSAIDGKRSLVEIASLVSQRYGLSAEDALDAVMSFLNRLDSESVFRANVQA